MWARLRKYFIAGLVIFLPMILTIYLFIFTIGFADNLLGKYVENFLARKFGFYFQGVGILMLLGLIFAIGFFVTNFIGRKIYNFFENMLLKLPFFRQVYPAIKEMALFLFSMEKLAFKQVVMVEYPRKGIWSFGFLTAEKISPRVCDPVKQDLCAVFLPSSPSPVTGFVVVVPRKDIIHTDISIEEAVKINVSGGIVGPSFPPEDFSKKS